MPLTLVVWDVQHGAATYIKTPNGKHIVQDLGVGSSRSRNANFSPLLHLWQNYGVSQLDAVIITHPHRDHLDDIFNFDRMAPRVLYRSKHLTENEIRAASQDPDRTILDKYFQIDRHYTAPVADIANPFLHQNNDGVGIQFFHPTSCNRANLNNYSIVTVISHAGLKVVLPGDNEAESWRELLARNDFVAAVRGTDVFLAPHHGRASGYCGELFDVLKPRLTLLSDGPETDTSVTSNYSNVSTGWTVHHRGGARDDERKVLTTRHDGPILVEIGQSPNGQAFLSVTAD